MGSEGWILHYGTEYLSTPESSVTLSTCQTDLVSRSVRSWRVSERHCLLGFSVESHLIVLTLLSPLFCVLRSHQGRLREFLQSRIFPYLVSICRVSVPRVVTSS